MIWILSVAGVLVATVIADVIYAEAAVVLSSMPTGDSK